MPADDADHDACDVDGDGDDGDEDDDEDADDDDLPLHPPLNLDIWLRFKTTLSLSPAPPATLPLLLCCHIPTLLLVLCYHIAIVVVGNIFIWQLECAMMPAVMPLPFFWQFQCAQR